MRNPFQRAYSSEELEIFNFLSKVKLFSRLSHDEMSRFLPYIYARKYEQNEVVFFRKDPSQALYLLKKGEVVLSVDVGDELEPFNKVMEYTSFGNNTLVDETCRPYNAIVSSERAELMVIPKVHIADIFDSQLKIKSKMMEALAEIYNEYTLMLVKTYQNDKGFFNMSNIPFNF